MSKAYFILYVIFLISCNDLEDYYQSMNKAPVLDFTDIQNDLLEDSIKIGNTLNVPYQIKDEEKLKISLELDTFCRVVDDGTNLEFTAAHKGIENVTAKVTDSYSLSDSKSIKLTVFDNLPPVAKFSYVITQLDNSYFLTLDASLSYDKDEKFGGAIVSYEFSINNFTKEQSSPTLKYSINKGAVNTVKVRVKDNNNQWSNFSINYINN
jgi:hypothetical protein